jgi:hypothetical protein
MSPVIKVFSLLSLSILILVCPPTLGMGFIPTDAIARETPDPTIKNDLAYKRILAVGKYVKTYYREFAEVTESSASGMTTFCPNFGVLGGAQKIALFAFIIDVYVHRLPLERRLEMPIPDPKTMSPKQLEALKLEYGDLLPPASKQEVYDAISRFDEAQVDLKAREMLQLFQRGPVSPNDLHTLLTPNGIKKLDPSAFMKWILGNLKFCGTNP